MEKFKIFLINLLLFFIASILICVFSGIGLITAVYQILFKRAATKYFRDCAYEIDVLGNVMCQHFFNAILIKKSSVCIFGITDETISSVLGRNLRDKTLTRIGAIVAYILDKLDKDHCKKSIKN